jgi:hypothetical protein
MSQGGPGAWGGDDIGAMLLRPYRVARPPAISTKAFLAGFGSPESP